MLRGLFITGTDTGVGKTVTAAALMHRYRGDVPLRYWKPIQTGIEEDDDTAVVRDLGGCAEQEIFDQGVRLPRPVSPHLAARLSGKEIALNSVTELVAGEPQRRAKLLENAAFLRQRLLELALRVPLGRSQIIPVMIGENEKAVAVAAALAEQGFDARAIRPPSVPPGTARLRVSVNASLDQTTLERFAAALAKSVASITPCSVASS